CCRSRILLLPSVQADLELLQAAARGLRLICFDADHNASVDYSRWLSHRGWPHVYQTLVTRTASRCAPSLRLHEPAKELTKPPRHLKRILRVGRLRLRGPRGASSSSRWQPSPRTCAGSPSSWPDRRPHQRSQSPCADLVGDFCNKICR